jgi:hypothetical protein
MMWNAYPYGVAAMTFGGVGTFGAADMLSRRGTVAQGNKENR